MNSASFVLRAKALFAAIILALIALFTLHFTTKTPRIAYVDANRLLDSYQAMLDARRNYQRQKSEWGRNLQTLAQEAQQAADSLEKLPKSASVATRLDLNSAVQVRRQRFITYRKAVERQDPEEMQRLTQPVLEHTNKFLRKYGQQHGYDFVLSTSDTGGLVYANLDLDVTVQVAAGLNEALRDSLKTRK